MVPPVEALLQDLQSRRKREATFQLPGCLLLTDVAMRIPRNSNAGRLSSSLGTDRQLQRVTVPTHASSVCSGAQEFQGQIRRLRTPSGSVLSSMPIHVCF